MGYLNNILCCRSRNKNLISLDYRVLCIYKKVKSVKSIKCMQYVKIYVDRYA